MSKILTKPYKRWLAGTAMTSDQDEFTKSVDESSFGDRPKMVYVNAERMVQLEREGYFDV